jgi:hypothetical protein
LHVVIRLHPIRPETHHPVESSMNRTILNAALLATALLSAPMVAQASLVASTSSGVTFDDGGTGSGSFDFDASLSDETACSHISITTATVGAFTGTFNRDEMTNRCFSVACGGWPR